MKIKRKKKKKKLFYAKKILVSILFAAMLFALLHAVSLKVQAAAVPEPYGLIFNSVW